MILAKVRELLKKQHYALVGSHSAVQVCRWTKKSLLDQDVCYKQKFYGIQCHRCVQMTPAMAWCQHKCLHCWRPVEYTIGNEIEKIDEPEEIIEGCIKAQQKLLIGFGGNKKCNKVKLQEALRPKHFAISLAGESTIYQKLPELIDELKARGISSFVVSNGENPKMIAKINPTQLYVSVNAPNEELFKKICRPSNGSWKNLIETLKVLKKKKARTALRLTLIKGLNMVEPENYTKLIKIAMPMFVEVKGYVALGFSRQRLGLKFMPSHEEVKAFALEIAKYCNYKLVDEKANSRVVLLMQQDKDRKLKSDIC